MSQTDVEVLIEERDRLIQAMREALEPFAALAPVYSGNFRDEVIFQTNGGAPVRRLIVDDVRRARSLARKAVQSRPAP